MSSRANPLRMSRAPRPMWRPANRDAGEGRSRNGLQRHRLERLGKVLSGKIASGADVRLPDRFAGGIGRGRVRHEFAHGADLEAVAGQKNPFATLPPILEPESGSIRWWSASRIPKAMRRRSGIWRMCCTTRAMLAEGGELDDPAIFVRRVNRLIVDGLAAALSKNHSELTRAGAAVGFRAELERGVVGGRFVLARRLFGRRDRSPGARGAGGGTFIEVVHHPAPAAGRATRRRRAAVPRAAPPGPGRPLRGSGSGFLFTPWTAISSTNSHVVHGSDEITVRLNDDTRFSADLVRQRPGLGSGGAAHRLAERASLMWSSEIRRRVRKWGRWRSPSAIRSATRRLSRPA